MAENKSTEPPAANQPPPKREIFALKFLRAMIASDVAQTLGQDVFLLLSVIVTKEDEKRYPGSVAFWNAELLRACGFAKWERLDKARAKAIEEEWLTYAAPRYGSRDAGYYHATIPTPADHTPEHIPETDMLACPSPANGYGEGDGQAKAYPANGYGEGYGEGEHSSLCLSLNSPEPKKSARFVPPTVEEVAAYCRERNNGIDAQYFVDHYIGNGWMRGKTKMKDWRATVRTWEGNRVEAKGRGGTADDPRGNIAKANAWANGGQDDGEG